MRRRRAAFWKRAGCVSIVRWGARAPGTASWKGTERARKVHILRRVFYRADRMRPPRTFLKPQALRDDDGWCETVGDRNYNRLVKMPYAASHETMTRDDHLYNIVVELSHNQRPRVQGHGSAVFFHLRRDDGGPTAGCIAVSARNMGIIMALCGRRTRIVI